MSFPVGKRRIGRGEPCFLVAEVGINHNGDVALAKKMIAAAAAAGADAVKFQNYRVEDFLTDRSLTYEYVSQGKKVVESQYDMFKRCELPPAALPELRAACDQHGVIFFSTPTSKEGIADLVRAGAPLLKNGSDCLLHLSLIGAMAHTGLPTVLSTGMATRAEIASAVSAFRGAGGRDLVLLHCTSSYPTAPADTHLRKLPVLAAAFDCEVGFSDHTEGIVAALGAVMLGACFIEKHFTLDCGLPGPDHHFSSDPVEFAELVSAVRRLEDSLGSGELGPAASEASARTEFRLSCAAAADLPDGHVLTAIDITFSRPGSGLPPARVGELVGNRLRRSVRRGELLAVSDVEGLAAGRRGA